MNCNSHPKMNYLYIGIDCHKYIHTATMINCFNDKLCTITFNNDKKGFESLINKVDEVKENLVPIFGLEDLNHLGYCLTQFLLKKNYRVKYVNSNLSASERKKFPIISKNDDIDSGCIAKVLLDELDNLPNAKNDEIYWTLKQIVKMRESIIKNNIMIKNKLHAQLLYHYPNYNRIFCDVALDTSLTFFNTYPSPNLLKNVNFEELKNFFKENTNSPYYEKHAKDIISLINEYDIRLKDEDRKILSMIKLSEFANILKKEKNNKSEQKIIEVFNLYYNKRNEKNDGNLNV